MSTERLGWEGGTLTSGSTLRVFGDFRTVGGQGRNCFRVQNLLKFKRPECDFCP